MKMTEKERKEYLNQTNKMMIDNGKEREVEIDLMTALVKIKCENIFNSKGEQTCQCSKNE